jgi:hypothetical protein
MVNYSKDVFIATYCDKWSSLAQDASLNALMRENPDVAEVSGSSRPA